MYEDSDDLQLDIHEDGQLGTVFHTYTVSAPDRFVTPYNSFLQEHTPKAGSDEPWVGRKDEYPD